MSIVADYIQHGWSLVPIPPGTKGPRHKGWNTRGGSLFRAEDLVPGYGVGLCHAYSGTMALDVDQWVRTRDHFDVDALMEAPDAVTVDSHRTDEWHGKLLYKMPFGLVLPTRQIRDTNQKMVFELRCATRNGDLTVQDILPPTIHPRTDKPYTWGGKGHWSRLPMIPQELLNLWITLLKQETVLVQVDGVDSSWDEIQEALTFISPDCSRPDWIMVGMALHWAGARTYRTDEALTIWNDWSALSITKYPGEREIQNQWRSFHEKENPVTLGSLFHLARQGGWVRATPDASTLFGSVTPSKPSEISQNLKPIPPDINMNLWPEILRTRAKEVSEGVGCDPLVPLFAGLAAVCGVVDARTRLELMPGFRVPPVLWLMTIGDPADKKSPGSRPMLTPLRDIEFDDRPRYQKELLDWEAREALYAGAKKAFLEFAMSPEALLGGNAPVVPELPTPPVPVKITVSDITSQKLVRHAADRPRGLLCHLDEMNSWVRKLTDKTSGEDRSAWVVSYEGERYEMDRVGAGSIHAENMAVSIYGNIQPRVFRDNLEALTADGLLQRFIPAVLRHKKTCLGNPLPAYLTHEKQWETTLRLTFAMPPMTYKLNNEAYKVFRAFQGWYEGTKHDERLLGATDSYMTAFGKMEGLAGRLILIWHVIENPFALTVGVEIVNRVIRLLKSYVIPAIRYALGEVGGGDTFETWLTDYLIQYADKEKITMSEIRRSARPVIGKLQNWGAWSLILSAMEVMEQSHWVARTDDRRLEHRGTAEWVINPALKDIFQEYRNEVIKAKQRTLERWWSREGGVATKPRVHGLEEIEEPR